MLGKINCLLLPFVQIRRKHTGCPPEGATAFQTLNNPVAVSRPCSMYKKKRENFPKLCLQLCVFLLCSFLPLPSFHPYFYPSHLHFCSVTLSPSPCLKNRWKTPGVPQHLSERPNEATWAPKHRGRAPGLAGGAGEGLATINTRFAGTGVHMAASVWLESSAN